LEWVLEVKDSTGSLLFYCTLWGAVSAGGKSEDLLLCNSLIIPERTLSFADFISFLL
jgi:hypothetical protein